MKNTNFVVIVVLALWLGSDSNWIKIKLIGTVSNRSAIGAKVRVRAAIGGKTFWQMREISGGGFGQDDMRPNFGLGDAAVIETVRIEWPSGTVQELHNVAASASVLGVHEFSLFSRVQSDEIEIKRARSGEVLIPENELERLAGGPIETSRIQESTRQMPDERLGIERTA